MSPSGPSRPAVEAPRHAAVLSLTTSLGGDAAGRAPAIRRAALCGRVRGGEGGAEREMSTTREDVTDPMGGPQSDTSPGLGPLEPEPVAMGLVPAAFPTAETPTRPRRPASHPPSARGGGEGEARVDDLIEGLQGAEPWRPEKKATRETSGDAYAAHHSIARAPMRKPTPMPEAKVVLHVTAEHPLGARTGRGAERDEVVAARRARTVLVEGVANETVLTEATTARRRVGVASLLVAGALVAAAAMIALAAVRTARAPAGPSADRTATAPSPGVSAVSAPSAASGASLSAAPARAPSAVASAPHVAVSSATPLARSAKSASEGRAPAPRASSAAPRDPDSELFETRRKR